MDYSFVIYGDIMQPNLAELHSLRTHTNYVNYVRIVQGTRSLWAIILVKIPKFQRFGAVNPHH